MTMPNFLIIGAAKSGTSALYHYLRQHPQVYMSPRKETHFFAFEGKDPVTNGPGDTVSKAITDIDTYQKMFDGVTDEIAVGEASPTYIYIPDTAQRIFFHIPNVKMILLLRNPVDRAYSAYMHLIRDGREPIKDFAKALAQEDKRIAENWGPIWHYTKGGFYCEQLKRYYDLFLPSQIKIYLYEEFNETPMLTLQDIYHFLGVGDVNWFPDLTVRPNVSGIPKSKMVQKGLDRLLVGSNPIKTVSQKTIPFNIRWRMTTAARQWNLIKPVLTSDVRQELTELFRGDILQLQGLIEKDLTRWLTMET